MGIPFYFKHISKQYPTAVWKIKSKQTIPNKKHDSDNLYLDVNAVIHPAAQDVYQYGNPFTKRLLARSRKPDDKMVFQKTCENIAVYVDLVRPKLLYLAIDGVAGAAKQSQQRQRRFKSSYESDHKMDFDPNSITVGTEFMKKLSSYIHWFIVEKKKTQWKHMTVVFSNHFVPGEGEHKIIRFIATHHKNNEKHYIVSPDADLIMLSLQLSNVYILRENTFKFLDCKYFVIDINEIKKHITQTMSWVSDKQDNKQDDKQDNQKDDKQVCDHETLYRDYIMICCMFGNDFMCETSLHLDIDGLEILLVDCCVEGHYVVKREGVYCIENKTFQKLLENLADKEPMLILDKYKNMCQSENKNKSKLVEKCIVKTKISDEEYELNFDFDKYRLEYNNKYFDDPTEEELRTICMEYFTALTFVLRYYLQGIPSWTFSYNRYKPPLFCDLKKYILEFNNLCKFDSSKPPEPIEQLLSVMPKKSKNLIPMEYRFLYDPIDEKNDSKYVKKVKNYYPEKFEIDYDGYMKDYQGVPIIPFVDAVLLKKVYSLIEKKDKGIVYGKVQVY